MLRGEHSAILSTFIKLPFLIKIFILSIFEWLLKTGLTVVLYMYMDPYSLLACSCIYMIGPIYKLLISLITGTHTLVCIELIIHINGLLGTSTPNNIHFIVGVLCKR